MPTTAKKTRGRITPLAGRQVIPVRLVTAVAQEDVKAFSYKPGFAFKVVAVQGYCRDTVVEVTADVKIGEVSQLSAAFSFDAATRADATLNNAVARKGGSKTAELNVHYTSDADGALTDGFVIVTIEPV